MPRNQLLVSLCSNLAVGNHRSRVYVDQRYYGSGCMFWLVEIGKRQAMVTCTRKHAVRLCGLKLEEQLCQYFLRCHLLFSLHLSLSPSLSLSFSLSLFLSLPWFISLSHPLSFYLFRSFVLSFVLSFILSFPLRCNGSDLHQTNNNYL